MGLPAAVRGAIPGSRHICLYTTRGRPGYALSRDVPTATARYAGITRRRGGRMRLAAAAVAAAVSLALLAGEAHAQIPAAHVTGGLYMTEGTPVTGVCGTSGFGQIGAFTGGTRSFDVTSLELDSDTLNLDSTITYSNPNQNAVTRTAYFQITSASDASKALRVFNFGYENTAPERFHFEVPVAALGVISGDYEDETFTISPIFSQAASRKVLDNPNLSQSLINGNLDINGLRHLTTTGPSATGLYLPSGSQFQAYQWDSSTQTFSQTLTPHAINPDTCVVGSSSLSPPAPPPEPARPATGTPSGSTGPNPPRITILGQDPLAVIQGDRVAYVDAGATCHDHDGMALPPLTPVTPLDQSAAGTQFLNYTCSDGSDGSSHETREVTVIAQSPLFPYTTTGVGHGSESSSNFQNRNFNLELGDDGGLVVSYIGSAPGGDATRPERISYIEISAHTTGESLGIYNYTYSAAGDLSLNPVRTLSATVPAGLLGVITANPAEETFTARLIHSFVDGGADPPDRGGSPHHVNISNENIAIAEYVSFTSFNSDANLNPGGTSDLVLVSTMASSGMQYTNPTVSIFHHHPLTLDQIPPRIEYNDEDLGGAPATLNLVKNDIFDAAALLADVRCIDDTANGGNEFAPARLATSVAVDTSMPGDYAQNFECDDGSTASANAQQQVIVSVATPDPIPTFFALDSKTAACAQADAPGTAVYDTTPNSPNTGDMAVALDRSVIGTRGAIVAFEITGPTGTVAIYDYGLSGEDVTFTVPAATLNSIGVTDVVTTPITLSAILNSIQVQAGATSPTVKYIDRPEITFNHYFDFESYSDAFLSPGGRIQLYVGSPPMNHTQANPSDYGTTGNLPPTKCAGHTEPAGHQIPPTITLGGDDPHEVAHDPAATTRASYDALDPATCNDPVDGDITGAGFVSSAVTLHEIRNYVRTYTCTDSDGLEDTATRTVNVTDQTAPTIVPIGPDGNDITAVPPVIRLPVASPLLETVTARCDDEGGIALEDVTVTYTKGDVPDAPNSAEDPKPRHPGEYAKTFECKDKSPRENESELVITVEYFDDVPPKVRPRPAPLDGPPPEFRFHPLNYTYHTGGQVDPAADPPRYGDLGAYCDDNVDGLGGPLNPADARPASATTRTEPLPSVGLQASGDALVYHPEAVDHRVAANHTVTYTCTDSSQVANTTSFEIRVARDDVPPVVHVDHDKVGLDDDRGDDPRDAVPRYIYDGTPPPSEDPPGATCTDNLEPRDVPLQGSAGGKTFSRTFVHSALGLVDKPLPEYVGEFNATFTCTDDFMNMGVNNTVIDSEFDGPAILLNKFSRADNETAATRDTRLGEWPELCVDPDTDPEDGQCSQVAIEQGELYFEHGATCLLAGGTFAEPGMVMADVAGQRVKSSELGSYTVEYSCTEDGMTANAIRTVNVVEEVPGTPQADNRPIFRHDGDIFFGTAEIMHITGAAYDEERVTCERGRGGEPVVPPHPLTPLITAAMFMDTSPLNIPASKLDDDGFQLSISNRESFPPSDTTLEVLANLLELGVPEDIVILNVTEDGEGLPLHEFIGSAPPGQYEALYDCTDTYPDDPQAPERHEVSRRVALKIMIISPSGGDDDWKLNPTFGRAWDDNSQLVTGGFSLNGRTYDVTDNFHVKTERAESPIGGDNTATMKAYAPMHLDTLILSLGIPELSRATDAEAEVHVRVQSNYDNPDEYDIVEILHVQDEPLIDEEATRAELIKADCNAATGAACHEISITFRVTAPLVHDVMSISAMDIDRRITTTYINDGLAFVGEPLLPARTAELQVKRGNQHAPETIYLTQEDRRYNVWHDQHGHAWLQNSFGSWHRLTQAEFERLADPTVSVMTRTHSGFADLVEYERSRAALVFDSSEIASEVGGSFSHEAPVRVDKLKDPEILERLRVAEMAALEYLGKR